MTGRVEGQVAFITGAARGQGRSHAIRLAQEGADIIAVDICAPIDSAPYPLATPADLAETVDKVEALDRRIIAIQADVRDHEAMASAVQAGVAELGRLDIVSANAAISSFGPATELTSSEWRDIIDVNLTGVWNTARAAIPHLIEGARGGSIIITSSGAGLRALPNVAHYVASKHGVIGLMRSLAIELGPHSIRVNCVLPCMVDTPMVMNDAMARLFCPGVENPTMADLKAAAVGKYVLPVAWVEPVDISNAVLFLASDEARYITGLPMSVDAGFGIL
jgi:(+)-trans-carveol dehydrogenase